MVGVRVEVKFDDVGFYGIEFVDLWWVVVFFNMIREFIN